MQIQNNAHLSYCTNIHQGETWDAIFKNLKQFTRSIKQEICADKPFGIGLRLSAQSATTLLQRNHLQDFKKWLAQENMYVFTINGFPYGDFHNTIIKDQVHTPDWTTKERLTYTQETIQILAELLPDNIEGGISTSPISYRHWFNTEVALNEAKIKACLAFAEITIQLIELNAKTGKVIHLDIEPEPDGFLENTQEVIDFYSNFLFKYGVNLLCKQLNCSLQDAKMHLLNHIQICYDVCHFALAFESPDYVISKLTENGIKIGKIQISAALKCEVSEKNKLETLQNNLLQFDEPSYLHQSVIQLENGDLLHFRDLHEGINAMTHKNFKALRTHYHVPIFISEYHALQATQKDIIEALSLWKTQCYTNHLEVETYTWNILPEALQADIVSSISRELNWVKTLIKS